MALLHSTNPRIQRNECFAATKALTSFPLTKQSLVSANYFVAQTSQAAGLFRGSRMLCAKNLVDKLRLYLNNHEIYSTIEEMYLHT